MFLQGIILPMIRGDQQRISQSKRFVLHGTHPNPLLTLWGSIILGRIMSYCLDNNRGN